ncbi:MAG: hypothetical protein NC417_05640 [Candidatus Gastranaerophilales bacterium]|nr:hypothetical protein [Candidatus Gastranaerophilales bacterium]
MGDYYFKENIRISDYTYIFLCGVSLNYQDMQRDKRVVLSEFLKAVDENNRPIILEKYFVPKNKSYPKKLTYAEAGFDNLYQVEMLVNFLSDANFIILESISTGAEAGLFLGVPDAQKKTCLLVPDEMAVEEDKLGAFLRAAFGDTYVNILKFYPQIKRNKISQNVFHWLTFFHQNEIGKELGANIRDFIDKNIGKRGVCFTVNKSDIVQGEIYYKIEEDHLQIEIQPRMLMFCFAAILNCAEYESEFFSKAGYTVLEIEKRVVDWLKETFINSIAEKVGKKAFYCSIKVNTNIEQMSVNRAIGMILYLFSAAELLSIKKSADYKTTNRIVISKKMIRLDGRENQYFYHKYRDCVAAVIERKIRI